MRFTIPAAGLLLCAVVAAHAQTASPGPGNKAINQQGVTNPGAPVAGANSFTENQAQARIESHGFTNVTGLQKDADGVWRGTATKDGKAQSVAVDFQGNVVTQ